MASMCSAANTKLQLNGKISGLKRKLLTIAILSSLAGSLCAAQSGRDDPIAHYNQGIDHEDKGRYSEAIAEYRTAIRLDPRQPPFYFKLAHLQVKLGRQLDAVQTVKQLLAIEPATADAYLFLANIYQAQEDFAEAERSARKYLELRPNDFEGYYHLGMSLIGKNDLASAEEQFKRSLQINPDFDGARFQLGQIYAQRGEFSAAEEQLQKAVRLNPDNPRSRYKLGFVLSKLDRYEEAVAQLNRAVELAPQMAEAHHALAGVYRRMGRAAESARTQAEFERLSRAEVEGRQKSRRISAYHRKGSELLSQDKLSEALAVFEEILRLDPNNDLAYYRMAQIYYSLGQIDKAAEPAAAAVRIKDHEAAYHHLLALCLGAKGEYAQAITEVEKAIKLMEVSDFHNTLGNLYFASGDYQRAIPEYRRAVKLEPGKANFHLNLAVALEKAGRFDEARAERELYLKLSSAGKN